MNRMKMNLVTATPLVAIAATSASVRVTRRTAVGVLRLGISLIAVCTMAAMMHAQDRRIPHYCKTGAGVLGPYPNDGSVRVGDPCFGTKDGRRYDGTAVMARDDNDEDADNTSREEPTRRPPNSQSDGVPHYCKTGAGVLGPYPNDGSVRVGDPCYGTKNGRRYNGTAVMSRDDDE
jgi:hypothetical protein